MSADSPSLLKSVTLLKYRHNQNVELNGFICIREILNDDKLSQISQIRPS